MPGPPTFLIAPADVTPEPAWRRFVVPAGLVVAGVLLTLIDGSLAESSGEVFSLGPIRLAWLSALLALGGIALAMHRLIAGEP
jgi:hypothetical protein